MNLYWVMYGAATTGAITLAGWSGTHHLTRLRARRRADESAELARLTAGLAGAREDLTNGPRHLDPTTAQPHRWVGRHRQAMWATGATAEFRSLARTYLHELEEWCTKCEYESHYGCPGCACPCMMEATRAV